MGLSPACGAREEPTCGRDGIASIIRAVADQRESVLLLWATHPTRVRPRGTFWRVLLFLIGIAAVSCNGNPPPPVQRQLPKTEYKLPVAAFDLVVLVDQSGSMNTNDPGNFRAEIAAFLLESLGSLEAPKQCPNRAAVVHFGDVVCGPGSPHGCGSFVDLREGDDTRAKIRAVSSHPTPARDADTDVASALKKAATLLGNSRPCAQDVRKLVVVLTDGLPDPDGTKKDPAPEFAKIAQIWRPSADQGADLVVLGLDETGKVFTPQIVAAWKQIAKGEGSVHAVPTVDALLEQAAEMIARLTRSGNTQDSTVKRLPTTISVPAWTARLDVWFLGAAGDEFPRTMRPGNRALDPEQDGRLVRGEKFAVLRVNDPAVGDWVVSGGDPALRVLTRIVPHELKCAGPFRIATGRADHVSAVLRRVDGAPIDLKGGALPGSLATRVTAPDGKPRDMKLKVDANDRTRYATEEPVLFDKAGKWTVELDLLQITGRAARRKTTCVVLATEEPRLELVDAHASVPCYPLACSIPYSVRVVEGEEATPLGVERLRALGNLATLVDVGPGATLPYDPESNAFVGTLPCPANREGTTLLSVRLMGGGTDGTFEPSTESWTIATNVSGTCLAVRNGLLGLALMVLLYWIGVFWTLRRIRKHVQFAVTLDVVPDKAKPATWKTNGTWTSRPFANRWYSVVGVDKARTTVRIYRGPVAGGSSLQPSAAQWRVALRWALGCSVTISRSSPTAAFRDIKFKLSTK